MPKSPGQSLDRTAIVDAALELLDEVGLDKLSTRALADHLGIKSPALYWHFENKQALVDAMAEQIAAQGDWPEPPDTSDDAAAWLADRARAFRGSLLAHRDGARVHAGTRPTTRQLPAVEAQVAALAAAGMSDLDAARAVLAISRFTVGWVLEEQASAADAGPPDLTDLPHLTAARAVLVGRDADRDFDFGLEALIAGILSRPARRSSHSR
jgi:TetR/AcrR family transcriptional regulator, tetracycline repressor protein